MKSKCKDLLDSRPNFLNEWLFQNLVHCLKNKLSLRLYQMENTVLRTSDGLIMMTIPTAAKDRHVDFRDELSLHYQYETGRGDELKNRYHVFSLLEVISFQCGFFTWEDIRKQSYLTY